MKVIEPLQLNTLHRVFSYHEKNIFAVSIPIAFSLVDGEILLGQELWTTVIEQSENGTFDTAMPKGKGEVLVCGSFFAPSNELVQASTVHLQVSTKDKNGHYQNQIDKELVVFGNRHWCGILGTNISPPELTSEMPITYHNAYGGEGYALNPDGKGFGFVEADERQYLPNVEYINQLLISSSKPSLPASFGPLGPMWPQRLPRAGTYEQEYSDRFSLADDIDWSYFNVAAEDQWLSSFFSGNEKFSISNMHPLHQTLSGTIPPIYGRAFVNQKVLSLDDANNKTSKMDIQFKEIPTKLDTLWLFPNVAMGVMIYRGTIEVHSDDGCDIESMLVACENRNDTPRTTEHYQEQLTKRIDPDHGYQYALFSSPLIAKDMKCAHTQLQENVDFPLEMSIKNNVDEFPNSKKDEAVPQVYDVKTEIIEQCKTEGFDPDPYLEKINNSEKTPEQAKIRALLEKMAPGIVNGSKVIDISDIDFSVMDEIKAFIEEIEAEAEAEAERDIEDKNGYKTEVLNEIARIQALPNAHLFTNVIVEMQKSVDESDMTPMWPRVDSTGDTVELKKQIASAQKAIDVLRKQGTPEERLPKIDITKLETQLLDAELLFKGAHLLSAHLEPERRSPHPEKEAELRKCFLDKFNKGESLIDGDYACIDLSGENLRGIDLSGCYLEGVDFSGCDLSDAILKNAIMAGADLSSAKLINTNCQGSNLGAANLTDTNFSSTNLDNIILSGSNCTRTQFICCQMKDMDYLDSTFEQTVFDNSIMTQSSFIDSIFINCSFVGSELSQTNFIRGRFTQTNFSKAILNDANFIEVTAQRADFCHAEMINSRFLGGCNLNRSKFVGANMSKSCLRANQLNDCDFSSCLLDKTDFSEATLENAILIGAKAIGAQFVKSYLKGADLCECNLMEASLCKAYLVNANFRNSNLYAVNFLDTTLGDTYFHYANLDQTILEDWRPS